MLVSMADGVTTSYALSSLEDRGVLFVGAGIKCYPGLFALSVCLRVLLALMCLRQA
jgi:predicted membrane GTPase involved in stress response